MGLNVPDLRGLFLRGYGSQSHSQDNGTTVGVTATLHESGRLGTIQGDATRKVSGRFWGSRLGFWSDGVMSAQGRGVTTEDDYKNISGERSTVHYDNSLQVPVSTEIRPINISVRYLMRAIP